jgi:hypothetical protein
MLVREDADAVALLMPAGRESDRLNMPCPSGARLHGDDDRDRARR